MSKNIFKSKTFWFNLLALLNELIKILPGMNPDQIPTVPTETLFPIVTVGNMALRLFTTKEVTILPQPDFSKPSKKDW